MSTRQVPELVDKYLEEDFRGVREVYDQVERWLELPSEDIGVEEAAGYSIELGDRKIYLYGMPPQEMQEEIESKVQYENTSMETELEGLLREPLSEGVDVMLDEEFYKDLIITLKPVARSTGDQEEGEERGRIQKRDLGSYRDLKESYQDMSGRGILSEEGEDLHVVMPLESYPGVVEGLMEERKQELQKEVNDWNYYASNALYSSIAVPVVYGTSKAVSENSESMPALPEELAVGGLVLTSGAFLFSLFKSYQKSWEIDDIDS